MKEGTANFKYEREYVKLEDGGQVALDWAKPTPKGPLLLIIPGVTGHNDDVYIYSTITELVKQGWAGVVVNHRGCSYSKLSSPKFYCAGSTDIREVVEYLTKVHPD